MAKAAVKPTVVENLRQPVTARGLDLLKLIADAGGLFLTQEEAADIIAAGQATVDLDKTEGNTALVTLTDAGQALVNPPAPPVKASIEIDAAIPMPEKKKGGRRGSKYPFDALQVGQSFHVPKTKENPDPVSALASSLTGARRRFAQPLVDNKGMPIMETVEAPAYQLDASGKRVKGADGHWVVVGKSHITRPKTQDTRDFVVAAVDAKDPRGPGARVWRTK